MGKMMNHPKFEDWDNEFNNLHIFPHVMTTSGSMSAVPISPRDPIFFAHHGQVDRMFSAWQKYWGKKYTPEYTSGCASCKRHLVKYDEPIEEWMGTFDLDRNCVKVPKSNPTVCIQ